MSVLIKGMKMPTDCRECPMETYYNCGDTKCLAAKKLLAWDYEAIPFDGRADWCPLVEVPEPHGRLIDADAYCEYLLEEAHRVWGLLKPETIERINRTVDDLKNYPAVVEAEGR